MDTFSKETKKKMESKDNTMTAWEVPDKVKEKKLEPGSCKIVRKAKIQNKPIANGECPGQKKRWGRGEAF